MEKFDILTRDEMIKMMNDIQNPQWGHNIANHLNANEDFIFSNFFLALLDGCRQQLREVEHAEKLTELGVGLTNSYERQRKLHTELHDMVTNFCIKQNNCNPVEAFLLITFEMISVTKFFLKTTDLGKASDGMSTTLKGDKN